MQNLKIITLRDVAAERVSWLWNPYIPQGKITIIQGDPGDGKTTLALAIAAAVTHGEEVGGSAPAAPANVIFQTAEDGLADTIKPRLEAMGADCGRAHVIDESESQLSLSDNRIERAINEKDAKLLVLDPLQAYLGGADMHSVNGVRPLMRCLAEVAERTACAMVVIGHLNKQGGKAAYRGLGSIDIYAAARSVLTVGRILLDENMRAVVHGKSNLAAPGASLAFGLDDSGSFTWLGDYDVTLDEIMNGKPSRDSQFDRAKRFIKNALADGAVPATVIFDRAAADEISQKTLNRAKSALGVISTKRGGQWYWDLPIDAEYSEVGQNEAAQDGQEGQRSDVTALTFLPAGTEG
jgi:energy-coupling factor transporter ATP-binding protein EcfA2